MGEAGVGGHVPDKGSSKETQRSTAAGPEARASEPGELAVQSVSDPGGGSPRLLLLCFLSCRFQTWISALAESLQVTYYPSINALVLLTLEWVCPLPPITKGYTVSSG